MEYNRESAVKTWQKWNADPALWRHALAVEACMRHFAATAGEDQDAWGLAGLLHDVDWERFPAEHCVKARELLAAESWPEWLIRAVQSHGHGLCIECEPVTPMEKSLFAIDEMTGFIGACAVVRPSKSVLDIEVKSVKKKWKALNFAAGVNREVVERGAANLGLSLDELIQACIDGMRPVAEEIGLKGEPEATPAKA
jgi:predicted hydrolase (HD superfamily)